MTASFDNGFEFERGRARFLAGEPPKPDDMTLRDWFAGQAMSQGMATLVASGHNLNAYQLTTLATTAYAAAAAMLEARK